jgi:hypothetical protein
VSLENEPETTEQPDVGAQTEENAEAWADAPNPNDPEPQPEGGDDAAPASESPSTEEGEPQAEAEATTDEYAEPPEFWSAERKALWNKDLPVDLRQAIHEHYKDADRAITGKLQESADARKKAETELQRFAQERDQLAAWWQQTAPQLHRAFANKWDGVDWVKMATDDPALYAQASAQRDAEAKVLQDAHVRHQAEVAAANTRSQQAFQQAKAAEHTKLAAKLPQHFGGEKAQATYDEVSKYLTGLGIPPERVAQIYEAPVIETAFKAMLYDKAQAALKAKPTGQPTTATQTSRRVVPGARPSGQPTQNDSARQAMKRLRETGHVSEEDASLLFE